MYFFYVIIYWYILYIIILLYIIIYIYREREKDNKPNRKELWFDFHIRYRAENIAYDLPPFGKNRRSMQNPSIHVMRFQILFLMISKKEQSLKQHCHLYQKIEQVKIPSVNNIIKPLIVKNVPCT